MLVSDFRYAGTRRRSELRTTIRAGTPSPVEDESCIQLFGRRRLNDISTKSATAAWQKDWAEVDFCDSSKKQRESHSCCTDV